jgi:hypothetical protein
MTRAMNPNLTGSGVRGWTHDSPPNTGVKLRSSITLGFVSFNSLFCGPVAHRETTRHRLTRDTRHVYARVADLRGASDTVRHATPIALDGEDSGRIEKKR